MLISIEGNIGTGKTTLMRYIKEHLKNTEKVVFIEEPVDLWVKLTSGDGENILEKFYNNKERWSYSFQTHAFITRSKELINQPDDTVVIIERSVLTDRNVFAKMLYHTGCMMDIEWKLYNEWFNWLSQHFKCITPDMYIYLQADTETSYQRMLKRSRKEETAVDYDYINAVKQKHDDWLLNESSVPVITLDVNNDFVQDELFRGNLIKSIEDIIHSQISRLPKSGSEQSFEDMLEVTTF